MANIGAPYLSTSFTVKPGHEEDFVKAWQAVTGWALAEGIITGATLIQSETDLQTFRGISFWPTEEARAGIFSDPAAMEMVVELGSHCTEVDSAPYRLRATAIGTIY